jgi:hypothetical protein
MCGHCRFIGKLVSFVHPPRRKAFHCPFFWKRIKIGERRSFSTLIRITVFAIAALLLCAIITPTRAYTITVINTNDSARGLLCQVAMDDGDHTMIDITHTNDLKGWICTVGGDFAVAPTSLIRLDDMSDHFIDVSNYGLISCNTGAQNNTAWLAVKKNQGVRVGLH